MTLNLGLRVIFTVVTLMHFYFTYILFQQEAEERAKRMLSWDVSNGVKHLVLLCYYEYDEKKI